jgi:prevent-host-death family protein
MRMGLRETNQNFSKAIKAVKAGRHVVLTERGTPIAVIRPLAVAGSFQAAVARLAAEGRLHPPATPGRLRRRRWTPLKIRGASLSRALRAERDAR